MKGTTKCQCGCGKDITEPLRFILESLERELGQEIDIISGARCAMRNINVGGVPNSEHTLGIAVDIAIPDSKFAFKFLGAILKQGIIKRIGDNYDLGNTFHIGIGTEAQGYPQNVIWNYKPKRR